MEAFRQKQCQKKSDLPRTTGFEPIEWCFRTVIKVSESPTRPNGRGESVLPPVKSNPIEGVI